MQTPVPPPTSRTAAAFPPRRLLHLYDLGLFDDVQLTAICDPSGRRVEEVFFVGD